MPTGSTGRADDGVGTADRAKAAVGGTLPANGTVLVRVDEGHDHLP
jgi:hypothetical protein